MRATSRGQGTASRTSASARARLTKSGRGLLALGALIAAGAVQPGAAAAAPANPGAAGASGPSISVVKLQRDSDAGQFTRDVITITESGDHYVVHTINYEVEVTNTGDSDLTLSFDDQGCDAGTVQGPLLVSGTLTGDVLSPGSVAEYTCSHALLKDDPGVFTNTATVTGTPTSGSAVSGTSSVTVKRRSIGRALKVCRTPSGQIVHYRGARLPSACQRHQRHLRHRNHRGHHRHHHHRASQRPKHRRGLTG